MYRAEDDAMDVDEDLGRVQQVEWRKTGVLEVPINQSKPKSAAKVSLITIALINPLPGVFQRSYPPAQRSERWGRELG